MRRCFWYSKSSVAADKPDSLLFTSTYGGSPVAPLTLANATSDFGYAVGKSKNSLLEETCSSLITSNVSEQNDSETERTFAIPTPRS